MNLLVAFLQGAIAGGVVTAVLLVLGVPVALALLAAAVAGGLSVLAV